MANEPIVVGTRVKIVKGCKARDIAKGVTARVQTITALGAEYGYSVRIVLMTLNGFGAGRSVAFYARHENRLSDTTIRMNDGIPSHVIEVQRA